MRHPRASLLGVVVFILLTAVPALAQLTGTVTISDYPRYATEVSAEQRAEMRRFAQAVVAALLGGAHVDVATFGHADFDAQGRDFETQISRDRAESAQAMLRELIAESAGQQALPPHRLQSLTYSSPIGVGTLRPVFPQPASEEERKANRRVEFAWTGSPAAPPIRGGAFERCGRVLASAAPPGPVRRMSCACGKFIQGGAGVQDSYYNFRNDIPGRAGFPDLNPQQWVAAMSLLVSHLRQDVSRASSNSNDGDFAQALIAIDDSIGRSINDFQSQLVGDSASGNFNIEASRLFRRQFRLGHAAISRSSAAA